MAKVLKTIAVISAFSLVIASFTACSLSFGKEEPTTSSSTTTVETTAPHTEESTVEETTTEPTTVKADNQEKIDSIFTDIKNFQIGTAGSSAKAAALALRIIAFSNSALAESDTLEDDIKALVGEISEDSVDNYGETLYQINRFAKKFFGGGERAVVDIAGKPNFDLDKDYSQEKYQKVYDLLNNF